VFTVESIHTPGVEEDQDQEHEDGALLGKPKTKIGAADGDTRNEWAQQNGEAKRCHGPDNKADADQAKFAFQYAVFSSE
jgi:hypothetical protein